MVVVLVGVYPEELMLKICCDFILPEKKRPSPVSFIPKIGVVVWDQSGEE